MLVSVLGSFQQPGLSRPSPPEKEPFSPPQLRLNILCVFFHILVLEEVHYKVVRILGIV